MEDDSPDTSETVCQSCAVGCRIEGNANGSRATGVAGTVNKEGRLCAEGIQSLEVVTDDTRLTQPQVRYPDGPTNVSWESAFERVTEEFTNVIETHGADALAFLGAPQCTNEENYLLQKLARTIGTNNVDNRARRCHVSTARTLSSRLGWPATTNSLEDIDEADVILIAGANPAERQPIAFNTYVRPAVANGTTLVHIDPRGNETTRLADVHIAPRPNTDAYVFDILSALVYAADGAATEFVTQRTRGYDEFARNLQSYDVTEAVSAAGVEFETVERVAERIRAADEVAAAVGTGIERTDDGVSAPDALLNLLLLTGNIGRSGSGLHLLRGLVNEQGATDAGCVPDRYPGAQSLTDTEAQRRLASEWGVAVPTTPGNSASELVAAFGDGIHGALIVGENPAVMKRERDWVMRRLDSLDVLVVVDIAASETTAHGDVVLPAAAGVEKTGTVTNLDRCVQRMQPVTAPPGNARPDWAILCELGQRLVAQDGLFEYRSVGGVFDEFTRVAPPYQGLSFGTLGTSGCRWPAADGHVLYRDEFETSDGTAPFSSTQPIESVDDDEGFWLITGGRQGSTDDTERDTNRTIRIHPDDAAELGITPGAAVAVSDGASRVSIPAALDETIRPGTVYLHAALAEPFFRSHGSSVTVQLDPVS